MGKKFVGLDVLLGKTAVCVIGDYGKIMNEAEALTRWLVNLKSSIFVRTSRDGKRALEARLSDKHIACLIKQTVLKSGIRSELPEKERLAMFSGNSLRAGLASSAEVYERFVQKHLGHASAEMTRRYQRRRDRFRVNLTKAAGL
jgi:integrase